MGVDLYATVQYRTKDDYWVEACDVWCGRAYHWDGILEPSSHGTVRDVSGVDFAANITTYRRLREHSAEPIWDTTVAHTPLYLICKGLAREYGKSHVRIAWRLY